MSQPQKKGIAMFISSRVLAAALLILAACGGVNNTLPISRGGATTLVVAGVQFTITQPQGGGLGSIMGRNTNADRVKILVQRLDRPATPLDVSFLAGNGTATGSINLEPGAQYQIWVRIWKKGLDLVSCPFLDWECFRSEEKLEFTVQ